MESADIKALRKQRAIVKAQLTRLQSFLEDQREISITALEIRHSKLEQMFNSFTEIQTIIETKDEESDHAPEWDSFEEQYYKVAETINNQLKEIRGIGGPVSVNRTVESPNTVKQTSSLLRKIEIKPFDGNPIEWHSFHDTFRSLVHDNDELIGVQKFHLLKNALRGEATAVIDSLNATEGNYLVAWDLLCKRCNKPRKIINAHLRLLLDLPEITRDTPINLRQLAEQAQVHVNALKAIKQPTEHWDTILIYIIANKLDKNTRRAWERTLEDEEIPKFKELLDFINKHARGDDIGTENSNSLKSSNIQDRLRSKPQARNHSYVSTNEKKQVCVICKGEHPIYACTKFLQLSVRDRLDTVKRAKLCINCLRPNHIVINCRLGNCRKCDKKHHTLLHFPTQTQDSNQNNPIVSMPSTSAETSKTTLTASYDSEVLLGTAQITILDKHNMEHTCRVLLDSGSQTHFITYRLAEILQLNKQKIDLSFAGLGQLNTNAKHIVKTSIRSQTGPFQTQLEFIALPSITGMLPVRQVNIRDFNIPSHIQLADPNFHKPGEIDALLGNALFYDLLEAGQIKLEKPSIILQNTQVGWIVTGEIVNQKPNRQGRAGRLCHIATSLDTQIARFWEIEEIPEHDFLSAEETECETHFAQNTTRNEQGRYIVRLPFNENRDRLGNSKAMALKRFYCLEHKLQLNSELKAQYTEFLTEYKNKFRKFLTQENIEWHFSPPRSPHFGGLWEAAVRSFKKHLHKTIGDAMLTYEQFYTLIVEIEAILNSRPLTPISSDPNDFLALSPNHFLIGESLASLPEQNFVDTQTNKLSLWQHVQKIKQHFWRRWQTEYLQELHTRSKWHTGDGTKIKEGTLVTIRDENCPPLQWQLGRVVALHPGEDDVVRVATIQTPHGTYKRALKKLAPLPIETN
ncbi:hypothetical protein ANTRET_LOCUS4442 [Anthophora retusa]